MRLIFLFLFSVSLYASNITLAVAANVSYAIKSLIVDFNKIYPEIKVNVVLGSSGKLTAQIQNHAPYDIFLSANMKYPIFLYQHGLTYTKPVVYAKGEVVVFSPRKKITSFEQLNKLKRIAMPNPKLAPYGRAASEFINKCFDKKLNIIYTQTVTQALSYSFSATDGAFIAKSALFSPKMSKFDGSHYLVLPSNCYHPIKQGMVILKRAMNNKDAAAFFSYMLSTRAANILKKYGYSVE